MIEFNGFLISCEIVEFIKDNNSPSALELSARIF